VLGREPNHGRHLIGTLWSCDGECLTLMHPDQIGFVGGHVVRLDEEATFAEKV